MHQIFTNILPSSDEPPHRLDEARGDAPTAVADLITQLTDADPRKRPSALAAGRRLSRIAREPVTAKSLSSKRLPGRQKSRADATY